MGRFRLGVRVVADLTAERHAEIAQPLVFPRIDITESRAVTIALARNIGIVRMRRALDAELHALLAVLDRPPGRQLNLTADSAFDVARGLCLVNGNGIEQFRREDAEVDRAVAAPVGRLPDIDGGGAEVRPQSTDGNLGSAAVLAMSRRACDGLQRFTDGQGRQRADLVGIQPVDDLDRIPLELDRVLDRSPHACNDDLLKDIGFVGTCLVILRKACARKGQRSCADRQRSNSTCKEHWILLPEIGYCRGSCRFCKPYCCITSNR